MSEEDLEGASLSGHLERTDAMGEAFTITTAISDIELDKTRHGGANFSVTNETGRALGARAEVVAEAVVVEAMVASAIVPGAVCAIPEVPTPPPPPPGANWFTVVGGAERNFPVAATEAYQVDVQVPPTAPPATPTAPPIRYRFRLDMLGTDNPDEDNGQGQWIAFTVNPPPPKPSRFRSWWIIAGAAAMIVLVAVSVGAGLALNRHGAFTPSTSTVNFGTVAVMTSVTLPVTVKNTGSIATTVKANVSSGTGFSVVSSACVGRSLDPNATCAFNVMFLPTSGGTEVGSIQLSGDHATTVVIAVTGAGGTVTLTPSPSAVNFGTVAIWTSATQQVMVTNTGPVVTTVNAKVSNGTGFSVAFSPCLGQRLAPNSTCVVTVTFRPTNTDHEVGTLQISGGQAETTVVALAGAGGTGTLASNPSAVNFGSVTIGTTATLAVTLKNTGTVATTVTPKVVSGTGFVVVSSACLGRDLAPNATCVFHVAFEPTSTGHDAGSLQITGAHAGSLVVTLSGTGTPRHTPTPIRTPDPCIAKPSLPQCSGPVR